MLHCVCFFLYLKPERIVLKSNKFNMLDIIDMKIRYGVMVKFE